MAIALAAPHPRAAEAGRRAAAEGGNALDAALAAAIMLTVVYPHQCALGGDLIALVRSPEGETTAVIAAGTAPEGIHAVSREWAEVPRAGAHSVTIPGIVAGWTRIAGLGARHPLASAFTGAAGAAAAGVPVSAGLARAIASRASAILDDAGLRAVLAPGGRLLGEGDLLSQPALSASMRQLAADPNAFYTGGIAESLARTLSAHSGVHTAEDFARYRPEVVAALSAEAQGGTWFVAPPPSGGAILLGVVAALHAGGDDRESATLAASVRGSRARSAFLGDPRTSPIDLDGMLNLIDADAPLFAEPRPQGDTAAVVAGDDEGWAVSIVQSVYQTFGAGLMDPETGILFHNRGSAFSTDPASPAAIRPGARPPHTLTPAIVERDEVLVVAGCQGGRAQPWILAQLLPDTIDPSASLDEVLARPRWVIGDRDLGHPAPTFVAEPGVRPDLTERATALGLAADVFPGPADEAGHVQIVRRTPRSGLEAASDPRADGVGTCM